MNDAALDDFVRDFDESASEIWEKWFRNSSKRSSVNERLDMIKVFFFEKRIEWMTILDGLKKKDVWDEIQSSTKKMRFVCWLIWLIL